MNTVDILNLLQSELIATLRRSRDVYKTNSTITLFDQANDLCFLNQTLPTGEITCEDLLLLEDECKRRNRRPFFEFAAELWPQAIELLKERGYEQVIDGKTMVHDRLRLAPSPDASLLDEEHLREFYQVGAEAFGESLDTSEDSLSEFMKRLDRKDSWASAAWSDGRIVAVGTASGNRKAVEIAGVGTRLTHRRRGFASQVVNHLLSQYYQDGGEVAWLSVAEAELVRFYEQLGFRVVGSAVGFSAP
jgi:ribosomal protein S18 acetylase RimI-like enzyme